MDESTLISALVLGVVEGVTEFIPVCSTGHLILLGDLIGLKSGGPPDSTSSSSSARSWRSVSSISSGCCIALLAAEHRRRAGSCWHPAVAFLPAAVVGFLAHDWIKSSCSSPTWWRPRWWSAGS